MITNKTYDMLKYLAVQVIPALNVLILAVGKIWDLPYYVQIAATISAIGVFIGAVIRQSSKAYYEDIDGYDERDVEEEFIEEDMTDEIEGEDA